SVNDISRISSGRGELRSHGRFVSLLLHCSWTFYPEVIHKVFDPGGKVGVLKQRRLYTITRVHNRRVIATAKLLPNSGKGSISQLAGEVHRDLTGERHAFGTALRFHLVDPDPKELGDRALDRRDGDRANAGLG